VPTANRFSSKKVRSDTNPIADGPRELRPLVEWLTSVGVTDHWVISCYLKLEPRDRTRGKYLIKLKNRVKARLAWLDEHEPDRTVARNDVQPILHLEGRVVHDRSRDSTRKFDRIESLENSLGGVDDDFVDRPLGDGRPRLDALGQLGLHEIVEPLAGVGFPQR